MLDGTLLGSLPAQAEPETATGLTHEHVVSYGAQDAVDCSTRPPDPPQALEWLTELFGTLEGDGGGSERQEPLRPTTSPTPDSLDHSQGSMTPRQQALCMWLVNAYAVPVYRRSDTSSRSHARGGAWGNPDGGWEHQGVACRASMAGAAPGTSKVEAYTSTGSSLTSFSRWRRRVQRAQLDLPPRP